MRPQIQVAFAGFWPEFTPESFRTCFPLVHEKYDLVPSATPEVVFYSVFLRGSKPYSGPRGPVAHVEPGPYLRVFFTGENVEPEMDRCDFAISYSRQIVHPNHLRLPLWAWGGNTSRLIKDDGIDWEKVAAERTEFCNYVYSHDVAYRDAIFIELARYKRIDAAGRCRNNMGGWTIPRTPTGKLDFIKRYKFTLALENSVSPGYVTEKLIEPMLAHSIPIYVGDPNARESFNDESYIDLASAGTVGRMLELVREVDNNRDMYLKMLAAPFYRNNKIPEDAREEKILSFFDRIFETAIKRRAQVSVPQRPEVSQESLLQQGIYVTRMTTPEQLSDLCRKIRPVQTKFELIRIGGTNDGGYLLPDDFENIAVCFSPGVDVNASFELDLQRQKKINSHLADYSVNGPPMGFEPRSFTKKYLGAFDDSVHTTLDTWVRNQDDLSSSADLLLQMDIEGGEYLSLLSASEEILKRFRIIVVEIHFVPSWGDPTFFKVVEAFFEKLLKQFYVVHIHPNNCCGLINLGGFLAPRVFELTLLRKDRSEPKGFCEKFPHRLDRANLVDRDDLILPENWYIFDRARP